MSNPKMELLLDHYKDLVLSSGMSISRKGFIQYKSIDLEDGEVDLIDVLINRKQLAMPTEENLDRVNGDVSVFHPAIVIADYTIPATIRAINTGFNEYMTEVISLLLDLSCMVLDTPELSSKLPIGHPLLTGTLGFKKTKTRDALGRIRRANLTRGKMPDYMSLHVTRRLNASGLVTAKVVYGFQDTITSILDSRETGPRTVLGSKNHTLGTITAINELLNVIFGDFDNVEEAVDNIGGTESHYHALATSIGTIVSALKPIVDTFRSLGVLPKKFITPAIIKHAESLAACDPGSISLLAESILDPQEGNIGKPIAKAKKSNAASRLQFTDDTPEPAVNKPAQAIPANKDVRVVNDEPAEVVAPAEDGTVRLGAVNAPTASFGNDAPVANVPMETRVDANGMVIQQGNGYQVPHQQGYQAPHQAGYQAPHQAGYQPVHQQGYQAPHQAGYQAPHQAGYHAPHQQGYQSHGQSGKYRR